MYVVLEVEVPSQFSMGQTVQSLTCSIMEKPHTGLDHLDECPRILLSCFRARNSEGRSSCNIASDLINLSSKCLLFCGSSPKSAERSSMPTLTVITLARWSRMEEDAFRYVLFDSVRGNSEMEMRDF